MEDLCNVYLSLATVTCHWKEFFIDRLMEVSEKQAYYTEQLHRDTKKEGFVIQNSQDYLTEQEGSCLAARREMSASVCGIFGVSPSPPLLSSPSIF